MQPMLHLFGEKRAYNHDYPMVVRHVIRIAVSTKVAGVGYEGRTISGI